MKRSLATLALTLALVGAATAPAAASPPVGAGGHIHHVVTGNGSCVLLDSVAFLAEPRGLHRGAGESGSHHGPWHGSCP